ncbi:hypothetical protein FACS189472_09160 [Alphaproteobacteria bacterium]|nr:hypothetical protein FACS189472_09160 [Alphaproteobacteria bacterium]
MVSLSLGVCYAQKGLESFGKLYRKSSRKEKPTAKNNKDSRKSVSKTRRGGSKTAGKNGTRGPSAAKTKKKLAAKKGLTDSQGKRQDRSASKGQKDRNNYNPYDKRKGKNSSELEYGVKVPYPVIVDEEKTKAQKSRAQMVALTDNNRGAKLDTQAVSTKALVYPGPRRVVGTRIDEKPHEYGSIGYVSGLGALSDTPLHAPVGDRDAISYSSTGGITPTDAPGTPASWYGAAKDSRDHNYYQPYRRENYTTGYTGNYQPDVQQDQISQEETNEQLQKQLAEHKLQEATEFWCGTYSVERLNRYLAKLDYVLPCPYWKHTLGDTEIPHDLFVEFRGLVQRLIDCEGHWERLARDLNDPERMDDMENWATAAASLLEICSTCGDAELGRIAGPVGATSCTLPEQLVQIMAATVILFGKTMRFYQGCEEQPEVIPTWQQLIDCNPVKNAVAQIPPPPLPPAPALESMHPVASPAVNLLWGEIQGHAFDFNGQYMRLMKGVHKKQMLEITDPGLRDAMLNGLITMLELHTTRRGAGDADGPAWDNFMVALLAQENIAERKTLGRLARRFAKYCLNSGVPSLAEIYRNYNCLDRSDAATDAAILAMYGVGMGYFLGDSHIIRMNEPSHFAAPTDTDPERILIPTWEELLNSPQLARAYGWEDASAYDNQPEPPSVTTFFDPYTPAMYLVAMQRLAKIESTVNAENLAEAADRGGTVAIPDLRYRLPANADFAPERFIQAVHRLVELVAGRGGHNGNMEQALASLLDPKLKNQLSELEKISSVLADFCLKSDDPARVSLYENCNPASKNESSVLARIAMMYDVILSILFGGIRADNEPPDTRGLFSYREMKSAMQRRVVLPLEAQRQAEEAAKE